ncbi:MAG TPA: membrane protein insertase YidC [Bdellovibrionales bacterium]|nr:membrane protein insertase YidC [Bdellovibrionales bacterium]
MKKDTPNFFDARTIIAIVLVAGTFMGWQYYMQKKYPQAFNKNKTTETAPVAANSAVKSGSEPIETKSPPVSADRLEDAAPTLTAESVVRFENANMAFDLSSKGMGIANVTLNKYKDREGKLIEIGHAEGELRPLQTRLRGQPQPLDFKVERINENMFVGRARVGTMEITKSVEIDPVKYLITTKITSSGADDRFVGLTTVLTDRLHDHPKASFFLPNTTYQEFYVETAETHDRYIFEKTDVEKEWSKVRIASIGSPFFTQAVADRSNIMPKVKAITNHEKKQSTIQLEYETLTKDPLQIEYLVYIGPKSLDLLNSIDPGLSNVVDFGYFNWIGRQILSTLKWFHQWTGNWGMAIILLTLLVRILVFPFNMYSYKSMKAMQVIQPKIQAARERYKDDQQKQQQEIMGLMRENKVNPIGGCLPIFLQFPIFLALYQVLGHSIELYQAPFMLWIPDLSLKDPYYILPVLMGATMFVQQKITPNTMDPAQAKILLFMPLVFTIFMIELASGLTLYMWVGAVFSVLQQLYFMRDNKGVSLASVKT